ncbi:hypothetical protein PHMEG_00024523 [Phytophthora megakarya]|uniref:RING-type domain-containing protein n=1 Tax=Phytophthora megakarya TaxID=4795 RepID=A0A225VFR2_9STRA|nr:hypothetical protein PHMEG_00024523 [Phytophthora megakarya]
MAPNAILDTQAAVCVEVASITCQICLEEFTSKDQKIVTRFCSTNCPAVFCTSCLERLLQVAMQVPYTGALPKVCCPICLVPVNKQQWIRFLDSHTEPIELLLQEYRYQCEVSCNFTCPGCHDARYTQLPEFYQASCPDRANATTLTLRPSEKTRIPELRRIVRRFCRHSKTTTARDVIRYITDNFPTSKTNCIIHKVFPLIQDEERRATLLLAYHSIYRRVLTRCCGSFACFNCKRTQYDETTRCQCEEEDQEVISDDDIIECRSCRVKIVKVDGCDSVLCICGFYMGWTEEQQIKNLHQRKLLPVDPVDRTMYGFWKSWHDSFQSAAGENYWELRQLAVLRSVNNSHPVLRENLRQFIWKRRFRQLIMNAELEMRHKFVSRWFPVFIESLRALVWRRRRFHRRLLDECRVAFVAQTSRRQSELLKHTFIKLMWSCRFRNVLGSLLRRFYCISKGWADLTEDELECEEEQLAFLSIGLN